MTHQADAAHAGAAAAVPLPSAVSPVNMAHLKEIRLEDNGQSRADTAGQSNGTRQSSLPEKFEKRRLGCKTGTLRAIASSTVKGTHVVMIFFVACATP